MNKRQKEVIQSQLNAEKKILKQLEKQYTAALNDINTKIRILQSDELTQSRIYRIEHQKDLKSQVSGILDKLHSDEYSTIDQFLKDSYTSGFIGTVYDLFGQGVSLILPIDPKEAVRAVMTDSKISGGLYSALGVDVKKLKKSISAEISRGLASDMSYEDITRNIANATKAPYSRARTIVLTETHRIKQASTRDVQVKAKEKGADVLKQWNSTLDGETRKTHRRLDGQIREVEEPFEMDGKEAMYPGDFNDPAEDCNCRCESLTRARWALGEDELATLKERAEFFGLDKTKDFEDFKGKYLKAVEEVKKTDDGYIPAKTKEEAVKFASDRGVKYVAYEKLPLETVNSFNKALSTLPADVNPVFIGDSATLEKYWGGKLPRSSKHYYGVTIDVFDGIHLGLGKGIDFDTTGQMVGISSSYKTAAKITASKAVTQETYMQKHEGRKWYFNETGETTAAHEMGHVYANTKGLPDGFEVAAAKWAEETKCDMLKKPTEAWAEAWAAYHTGANELPEYISKFIKDAK